MATNIDAEVQRLADSLEILKNTVVTANGPLGDLLQGLVLLNNANQAAANSTLKNVNARTVESELLQKRNEREQALVNLFQTLGSSFTRTINGLGSLTAQLYSSSNAFASAIISLDTFQTVFQAVTKIIQSSLSVFSFLRGAGNAFKNIADSGVDLAINALKNRIEQARIITDTFQTVGKAGAIFGGSLGEFTESAKNSKINLQEFGKFISVSVKDLAGLGQTMSKSSVMVADLGRSVGDANKDLLVLKGSFGDLASSAAEYIALQRLTGVDTRRDSARSAEAIANYIRQQNLLTELTGLSVADQRRQAEERRRIAAFNAAAAKLDDTSRTNLDTSLTLIGQQFGPQMASIARELFENNGQLLNEESIRLMQMMPNMLDYVNSMLENIRKPTVEFQQSLGKTNREYAPQLAAMFAELERSGLLNLQASSIGPQFLRQLQDATVAYQQNKISLEEFDKKVKEAAEAAAKGKKEAGDAGTPTGSVASAIANQNAMKIALDKLAVDNLTQLPNILKATGNIAAALVKAESAVANFANALAGEGRQSVPDALNNFRDQLQRTLGVLFGIPGVAPGSTSGEPFSLAPEGPDSDERRAIQRLIQFQLALTRSTASLQGPGISEDAKSILQEENIRLGEEISRLRAEIDTIRERRRNDPQRQEGGIATEPTTVGENNQPEAVIPLARGNIPLNINFGPMIAILEQQREYLEEILRSTDNNSDYLERIYHATA